jgi:hypothetical protein
MSLWGVANTGFSRFNRRTSDAPSGVLLAIVLLASLVLISQQHGILGHHAMLLNSLAQRNGCCQQAIEIGTRLLVKWGLCANCRQQAFTHDYSLDKG